MCVCVWGGGGGGVNRVKLRSELLMGFTLDKPSKVLTINDYSRLGVDNRIMTMLDHRDVHPKYWIPLYSFLAFLS